MLSKPLYPIGSNDCSRNIIIQKNKPIPTNTLSYREFLKTPDILTTYKLPALKELAKQLRLRISGTKPRLIERIIECFQNTSKAVLLQKMYRGYLVRELFRLRGNAFKKREICVNSSDFYSLEPIADIDANLFFSYKDEKDFWYGFDVTSLFSLISKSSRLNIINPYNREKISQTVINDIYSLGYKSCILFPNIISSTMMHEKPVVTHNHQPLNLSTINIMNRLNTPEITRLITIRESSVQNRMMELFMEIDQLGNYTRVEWFSSLTQINYMRLYRIVYNIWRRLSPAVRNRICLSGDPFLNIFQEPTHNDNIGFERIQEACLRVFENMVFTGVDIEYRKLGALHVLSALTIVSIDARHSIPWLYESLM